MEMMMTMMAVVARRVALVMTTAVQVMMMEALMNVSVQHTAASTGSSILVQTGAHLTANVRPTPLVFAD
jgi:hypothetical protein